MSVKIVVYLNDVAAAGVVCGELSRSRPRYIAQLETMGLEVKDEPMPELMTSPEGVKRLDYIEVEEHDVTEHQVDIPIRLSNILESLNAREGVNYAQVER